MTDRRAVESLLQQLYEARVRGDLDAVCACFCEDAVMRIAGASDNFPISIGARGANEVRRVLGMMVKSFKMSEHATQAVLVDGARAAVQWSVRIHSRITGTTVQTELMDLIEIREGRIGSYTEFFVRR